MRRFRKVSQEDIQRFGLEFRTNHDDPEDPDTKRLTPRMLDEWHEHALFEQRWESWLDYMERWMFIGPPKDCSDRNPLYTSEYLASQGMVGIYSDPTDISNLEI